MKDDLEFEPKEPTEEKELLVFLLAQRVVDWPFKIKMVTKDIDFSTPIGKAALATTLVASEIIDKLKALDIMDYQDVIDRMKADQTLDQQTTDVVKALMDGGMDLSQMTVQDLFSALMGKMTGAPGGTGSNKPSGPPTLEEMKNAQKKKAEGMKVEGADFVQRLMSRTKLPAPKTGVNTS